MAKTNPSLPDYPNRTAYRRAISEALEDRFLRDTLDRFAANFRRVHTRAFEGQDYAALTGAIARAKTRALEDLDVLYERFAARAEAAGARVHLARTADDANRIIAAIAKEAGARRVVKSKSMTSEEIFLNRHLEAEGCQVTETDLGEWIIQLKGERPSHMTIPAIHLSRHQVADLFSGVVGRRLDPDDVTGLVEVARQRLRQAFLEADMGITGANMAIADTGTIVLLANEGNIRLVTTLPPVHVALVGLEKLVADMDAAHTILEVLPRNVGGQPISSYVTWITGANACKTGPGARKAFHIVFLDNGRSTIARHPVLSEALRCVRCGACANVCPVYTSVGGHRHGYVYVGAIGLVLTWLYHGTEAARYLVENCTHCMACRKICSAGIDLPGLITEVQGRVARQASRHRSGGKGSPLARVITNRRLFHRAIRMASRVQRPFVEEGLVVRHLPQFFARLDRARGLPAIAVRPFRDRWDALTHRSAGASMRVAVFAGCLMDFVYPEQAEAMVRLLEHSGASVSFPAGQGCCGLPVAMMAEKELSSEVARQNLEAFRPVEADYIVTGCASCASHLKRYPDLVRGTRLEAYARTFAAQLWDISSFLHDVAGFARKSGDSRRRRVAYHAPCHLCRGLGVTEAPRALIRSAGFDLVRLEDEEVCCGFGGSYAFTWPDLSAAMVNRKLDSLVSSEPDHLVTDCPGCVLQLRKGAAARGVRTDVRHMVELLAMAAAPPHEAPT